MIRLRLSDTPENGWYKYRVADVSLCSDIPLEPLRPYFLRRSSQVNPIGRRLFLQQTSEPRVYSGEAWVLDKPRAVTCDLTEHGYLLELEDLGSFFVERDGSSIEKVSNRPGASDIQVLAQTVLGAPLILCLALKQVFSLHAGAIQVNNGVIGFMGESGYGKSTIAAYYSDRCENGIRISDDILVLERCENGIVVLPHFPQLKLDCNSYYSLSSPRRVLLERLFVLCPSSAVDSVRLEPLNQRDAILTLIQHSVATRLFGPDLLKKHWHFCAEVCNFLQVTRLLFPQKLEFLPILMNRVLEVAEQVIPFSSSKR